MKHLLLGGLLVAAVTGPVLAQDYPSKEIQGIIQWGAGGSTDVVMRTVTPHAERAMNGKVVMRT